VGHLSQYLEHHPSFAGLSAREVARRLGVGVNTAIGLTTGNRVPDDKTLVKIAEYLHPGAADVRERELEKLRELVLLDTPFELPEGAQLLNHNERALVKAVVTTLLESSGKAQKVPPAQPEELEATNNVVPLPQPDRVRKAAYDPPEDE
jgi:transcriptional regulator with XRE-family HTH domain